MTHTIFEIPLSPQKPFQNQQNPSNLNLEKAEPLNPDGKSRVCPQTRKSNDAARKAGPKKGRRT